MTRQRRDEQRKEQIRTAATRCFVKRGYAATRLLDIAREAGLSKGGVYFHYRAKEEIFQDILDVQIDRLRQRWSADPGGELPADRTLTKLVIGHLRAMERNPEEPRLLNLLVTMSVQDDSLRGRFGGVFASMGSLYEKIIRRGIVEGRFVDSDPQLLATCVFSLLIGLGAQCAVHVEGKLPASPEIVAECVLRMLRPVSGRPSAVEFPINLVKPSN